VWCIQGASQPVAFAAEFRVELLACKQKTAPCKMHCASAEQGWLSAAVCATQVGASGYVSSSRVTGWGAPKGWLARLAR
jgi:hypothetical protein